MCKENCYSQKGRSVVSNKQMALASLSRSLDGSEINPDGLAREFVGALTPMGAQVALDQCVAEGLAYKTEDNYYGPSEGFKQHLKEKLIEQEKERQEIMRRLLTV